MEQEHDAKRQDALPSGTVTGWRRFIGILGGVVLGAVLLFAAWAKALDPRAFAGLITAEGLDFLLPAAAVALVALALEVFLGGALALAVRRWWILWPTTALVAFFLLLNGRAFWRFAHGQAPADAGCGCFGNLVERTPAEAFWQDVLLMVPALLLAFLGRDRDAKLPRWRLAAVGGVTVAVVLLAWKAPDLPLDDLATRLKPGVDPMALCAGSADDGTRVCMDAVLPEIAQGEHVVVMAELEDGPLGDHVAELNEYHWAAHGPTLWVLTAATDEQLFTFRFSRGPSFSLREAPAALLRPLYRTLPRSFLVRDGRVVETYRGLPPLDRLAAAG
jgi:Methylamine utilisation protein MauE